MIRYIKENNEQAKEIPLECIKGATLLSKEEYEAYRDNIPKISWYWWLRSAGHINRDACGVSNDGNVADFCRVRSNGYGIRPTLILNLQSSNLETRDKFELGEHLFTIISNDLAICDDFIGKGCFREDWEALSANDYEKSDVKKVIDKWFENSINKQFGLKSNEEIFSDDDWGF